jgi:hydroxymethylbilane synthase
MKDLRGNVQTRLQKLDDGMYDAIVLASAGLIRLDEKDRIAQYIPKEISLPAVGQGVVVIEAFEQNIELVAKLKTLSCNKSYECVMAERAFNEELKGGCHVAIAAHAEIIDDRIRLEAMVASSDGSEILRKAINGIDAIVIGKQLAHEMIELGAYRILGK